MINRTVVGGLNANNGWGIYVAATFESAGVYVTVADSMVSNNAYGLFSISAAGNTWTTVRNSSFSINSYGIYADSGSLILVGQSTIAGNAQRPVSANGYSTTAGKIESYGNNNINNNFTNGNPDFDDRPEIAIADAAIE